MKSKINISKMVSNKVKHLQKDKLYNYSIFNDIPENMVFLLKHIQKE